MQMLPHDSNNICCTGVYLAILPTIYIIHVVVLHNDAETLYIEGIYIIIKQTHDCIRDGQLVCHYSLGGTLVLITKQFFVTDKVIQTTSLILSTY